MTPLRVLLVTQSYHPIYGGIGEHVRHLGLALRQRGHEVRVLTSGPAPEDGELPGLEVLRIGRRFRVPANGSSAAIALHPAYRRAVRKVVRDDPDVIHIHSPLEPLLPWAVLREARAPCVGTFHNAGLAPWGYRLFGRALAPLARRLAVRTAVSRSAAVYAGRHFPGEFLLIPNGVDIERFHPNGGRPADRPPTVLFVGRLEPRKGLDVLIEGLAGARERLGRDLRLIVVGDGSRRDRLLRGAQRARIDLRMRGSIDPDAVPRCYHEADLLVAPALYGESFGIVLLEALASGLPVVASRIDGFAEVLDGCAGARLFPPGDAGGLAERIVEVVRQPPSAAAARRHAVGYSWRKVAGMVEEAYLEATRGPTAPGPRALFTSISTYN
jgi:phosphatidylinositol alpha-mannosyltransferase